MSTPTNNFAFRVVCIWKQACHLCTSYNDQMMSEFCTAVAWSDFCNGSTVVSHIHL